MWHLANWNTRLSAHVHADYIQHKRDQLKNLALLKTAEVEKLFFVLKWLCRQMLSLRRPFDCFTILLLTYNFIDYAYGKVN